MTSCQEICSYLKCPWGLLNKCRNTRLILKVWCKRLVWGRSPERLKIAPRWTRNQCVPWPSLDQALLIWLPSLSHYTSMWHIQFIDQYICCYRWKCFPSQLINIEPLWSPYYTRMLARRKLLACPLNNSTATADKVVFPNQMFFLSLSFSLSLFQAPAFLLLFLPQLLLLLLIYALHVLGQSPEWRTVELTEVYGSTQHNSQLHWVWF